jgi:hypothetical protein
MPATDPTAPQVAMDANQIAFLRSMAGDFLPTLQKWWAVFGTVAALAYGISQTNVTSIMPTSTGTVINRQAPDDCAKKMRELEKSQADLLDVLQTQRQIIDRLKKGP